MRVCLIIILFIAGTLKSYPSTIKVCSSCSIKTIKEALAAAQYADTIEIFEGLYKEGPMVIDKPLFITGINWPKLDGESEYEIVNVTADSVTITGCIFQNVGVSYLYDNAAISLEKSSGSHIYNNKIINAFFGIYAKNSSGLIIENNEIHGEAEEEITSGNAIHLWYCNNITVRNNIASNHRDGIYLEFVNKSIIENNLSEMNLRYGLHFMFSNNDKYRSNTFRNNGAGVAVMFSKFIEMSGNTFELNWGASSYGLLLKEITDAVISGNRIQSNTVGIFAEGANRIHIKENVFQANGWAMKISGSCMDNVISKNNFILNTFDLSTDSSRSSNNFDGNYWSEYTGYDLDGDGKGDVPFRPVKLFSYLVGRVEPSIVLLRSFFINIVDFAEKVTPMFTPKNLADNSPLMKPWKDAANY